MLKEAEEQADVVELGAASDVTLGYVGGPFEGWLVPDMQDTPR